jgi:hypothetical protein
MVQPIRTGNSMTVVRMALLLGVVSMLVSAGCRDKGPRLYSVSGNVSFNGKPIEMGEITFAPVGGAGRPDSAVISNGNYQVKVTEGSKIIKVSAVSTDPELVGPPPPDMPPGGFNPPREYIPERFNEQSTLTAQVEAKNGQVFDFDLKK